ncbi:MAG: methyltransferase family protein [Bacillota bacterium]
MVKKLCRTEGGMMIFLRTVIFIILVPGTAICVLPYWLSAVWPYRADIGVFRFLGPVLIFSGSLIYFISVLSFLVEGKGTPAIWFTKAIRFLIGEEPNKLVSGGIYRISRNPMYLGVVAVVLGEAIYFERVVLLLYAAALWLFLQITILFIEEPHLKKKYGKEYEDYLKNTSRWFSFRKKKLCNSRMPGT